LVPVCFSASHVAYSSMRMEPQYMILGHAAGAAAALAVAKGVSVQAVPVAELQQILLAEGGVFEQGVQMQLSALGRIREKFAPARRPGKAPWARPEAK